MGKSCHMNSVSTPRCRVTLYPPPITKCPPSLTKELKSPCGKPIPPPTLKSHLFSSCARPEAETVRRMIVAKKYRARIIRNLLSGRLPTTLHIRSCQKLQLDRSRRALKQPFVCIWQNLDRS